MKKIKIRLTGKGIFINAKNIDEKLLRYGEKVRGGFRLNRLASLYFVEKGIKILGINLSNIFDFNKLVEKFSKYDKNILSKYLIYRTLTERGYTVMDGYRRGIDLLVYKKGSYPTHPPSIRIVGVEEGLNILIRQLFNDLHFSTLNKKTLVIGVIERRGEIVFYKLTEFGASHNEGD